MFPVLQFLGQIHWGVDFHGISIGEGQTRQKAGVRRRSLWLEVSGRCWWGQVKFCNPKDKKPDQESGAKVIRHFYAESCRDTIQADTRPRTICGLIPDSGTTMITGPESQLADLYMDPSGGDVFRALGKVVQGSEPQPTSMP